jgi:c-di-GMP-binding flagellar brake protein YcgR
MTTHTDYIPALLSALLTLELALAIHPQRNQDAVVRKTARRLRDQQTATGREYLQLLIVSKAPYASLQKLQARLQTLK